MEARQLPPSGFPAKISALIGIAAMTLVMTSFAAAIEPANRNNSATPTGPVAQKRAAVSEAVRPSADEMTLAESRARRIVSKHLPELRGMLDRLRQRDPKHYDRAVRDLSRWARRLETAKKRGEQSYDIELALLKSEIAVNLLTAKLKVRDNPDDRKQLREAVESLEHSRLERARYDTNLLRERIERTQKLLAAAEERIRTMESRSDADRNATYTELLRKAGRKE
ncbi:hypothetical protein K227x_08380 [Rubripirellula lacrimiformis]|uniref:Uncharacterized protein n=1 Tax=Rubripirellula lacrimiformis TaxID=1930273 RepID=A0A517N5S9_9BACT|nr:hypothetical protein [Rubripirellula lacrimiformis]QDT02461.1 hypothetical protein K227x_08380 [Rubripirellula lacrimiformis]